jgi:hypothetical protein
VTKQIRKVRINEIIFLMLVEKAGVCLFLTGEISSGERLSTFTDWGPQFCNLFNYGERSTKAPAQAALDPDVQIVLAPLKKSLFGKSWK